LESISRKIISNFYFLIRVSRAFGDLEAKLTEFGGNSKVLLSVPDIISFRLNELSDFIVLGSID